MCPLSFDQIIQVLEFVGAVTGAVIGLAIYRSNSRTRRAEWLYSLYAKFYEDDHYKGMRRILDGGQPAQLTALNADLAAGNASDLCEQLVDYLNFFEFVASLRKMNQVSEKEIRRLFDYYLRLLDGHAQVLSFVKSEGFEDLHQMLADLRAGR